MDSKIAILTTLTYSDIFHYPLTFDELYYFLITEKKYTKKDIKKTVVSLDDVVKNGYYFALKDRGSIIARRDKIRLQNEEKIKKAKSIAKKLFIIPTVLFIGISGGVAMKNAAADDDIDFFVITQKNTLWISRLFLVLFLSFLGVLRNRSTKQLRNMICLNMLIDETVLSFPKERQDLYTAHEITQIMPLIERKDTYRKFLHANIWVKQYMPNSMVEKVSPIRSKTSNAEELFSWIFSRNIVETLAKKIQHIYMKSHITKETVSSTFLAFHPIDYREKTLRAYEKRIKKYV